MTRLVSPRWSPISIPVEVPRVFINYFIFICYLSIFASVYSTAVFIFFDPNKISLIYCNIEILFSSILYVNFLIKGVLTKFNSNDSVTTFSHILYVFFIVLNGLSCFFWIKNQML